MNDKILLSIIVPVYNVEEYLVRCIDSILNQSFTDFELILVDDGSLDFSGTICDNYAKRDERICVIHQENKGVSATRNAGIAIAGGEYITFIDSDDLLVEDTYAGNMQILLNDESIDMLQFPYIYPYGTDKMEKKLCFSGCFKGEERLLLMYLSLRMNHALWNKIYHKSLFEELRFPEGLIFEDSYLIPDLIKRIKNLYCSNIGAYGYCLNEGSIMTSDNNFKKCHDRIIVYYRLMISASQFCSLKKYCFQLYSDLVFYYLGILQCKDRISFDKRLSDCIWEIGQQRFTWSQIFKSGFNLKRKCILYLVQLLGLSLFVKLFMLRKKCI